MFLMRDGEGLRFGVLWTRRKEKRRIGRKRKRKRVSGCRGKRKIVAADASSMLC